MIRERINIHLCKDNKYRAQLETWNSDKEYWQQVLCIAVGFTESSVNRQVDEWRNKIRVGHFVD